VLQEAPPVNALKVAERLRHVGYPTMAGDMVAGAPTGGGRRRLHGLDAEDNGAQLWLTD
jgi:hypothetical protein